jgi:NAD+ kinase
LNRSVLLVTHTGRKEALVSARSAVARLTAAGLEVRVLEAEAAELDTAGAVKVPSTPEAVEGAELLVVLGGDGTVLRAAELARPWQTPLLGVNLGHVGFLAEAEHEDLDATVDRIVARDYDVEERMTIDVVTRYDGREVTSGWALNDATVEKASRERMVEVIIEVDGRPVSRWGCDGVVCATPTGSTAYAFSAGGPIVWPEVDALLLVPISAHALFARPLVVAPGSQLAVELLDEPSDEAVLWLDGRRKIDLRPGTRTEVRRGRLPVRFARLHRPPFTDRLVAKFQLPVQGWRGGTTRTNESR